MAQETNILIQISNDGATWTDLVTLSNGTVSHKHSGLTFGTTKYYRTIAKGDGVNTLDSDPSTVVNVASGFVQRYQDVLDYASTNSIGVPSFIQNILNDRIVRNFILAGIIDKSDKSKDKLDILYYFKQEANTPYEFLTLNWIDATKNKLLNLGTNNVSFTGGSGFHVAGNNSQYMDMQYTPSLDAVHCQSTNGSLIFKTFNIPSVYSQNARIMGCATIGDASSSINILNGGADSILLRFFEGDVYGGYSDILQTELNSHFHKSLSNTKGKKLFKNGVYQGITDGVTSSSNPTASIHLFGNNYNETHYPSEEALGLSYVALGEALTYEDRVIYKILNSNYNFEEDSKDGVIGFTTAATSGFPSLYYPKVYKSEPFKTYFTGLTKKYIVFYSTNHADPGSAPTPANGAIGWGECDHPNLSGYIDKGIVAKDTANPISGYQSETPSVIINPNDPNGQPIWFFYHPTTTYPDAGGIQQTRLLTASGGTGFNDVVFTDRGKVLGLTTIENGYSAPHTGYADAYVESDGSITVLHATKGWSADTEAGIPNLGKSTCPGNSYAFTRIDQDMDITSFMPYSRFFHSSPSLFFTRNGIQYAVARNINFFSNDQTSSSKISIFQCDGNYHPTTFLGNISGPDSGNNNSNADYYIEGNTLYIYYIKNLTDLYVTTWDLKNLD